LGALGLCRRAGALATGYTAVCEAAQKGTARLVLLAEDLAPNTRKKVHAACAAHCPVLDIPLAQQQLAALAKKPVGVVAVLDDNFATLCQNALAAKE
ncbi:ribosomal L7Ae/L30e/S12e/Gadd45 family protein, partial [Ruminococcaceae bacterium OttesenSCG-928-O06]|nr:ribosomal L7Ae/L30e/S12e/Gadd45 family protein [Ruminococcaceae bacterium OttesenSCG-928-O06]